MKAAEPPGDEEASGKEEAGWMRKGDDTSGDGGSATAELRLNPF